MNAQKIEKTTQLGLNMTNKYCFWLCLGKETLYFEKMKTDEAAVGEFFLFFSPGQMCGQSKQQPIDSTSWYNVCASIHKKKKIEPVCSMKMRLTWN